MQYYYKMSAYVITICWETSNTAMADSLNLRTIS